MATTVVPFSFSGNYLNAFCYTLRRIQHTSALYRVKLLDFLQSSPPRTHLLPSSLLNSRSQSTLGGNHVKTYGVLSINSGTFVKTQPLLIRRITSSRTNGQMSIKAQYNGRSSGSGVDFVAGFLLGGALFGTLSYLFAPQIRRSLLNEDEYGFRRAKQPIYYDEGLEKTRQTLNEKISQLNAAIDNVSSRLRGGNNLPQVPVETDAEKSALPW